MPRVSLERKFLDVISGRTRGISASALRAALNAASPLYAAAIGARNKKFDRTAPVRLPRPTVSVGNLTTGGTGKTPVVQWLVARLRERGRTPAVLLRGYRQRGGVSDEAELYRDAGIVVGMNGDRIAGAASALQDQPATDVFVLDDGFQHRRVARDFDLVLLDATNPFGFGHLLPRGLLREPPASLARAHAALITRCNAVENADALIEKVRTLAPAVPVYRCRHAITALLDPQGVGIDPASLGPVTALAGIGNPAAFFDQLARDLRLDVAGRIAFSDHAGYDTATLAKLPNDRPIVTTEKDWAKLRRVAGVDRLSFLRAALAVVFMDDDGDRLFASIDQAADRDD